jgi:hypothetical protein
MLLGTSNNLGTLYKLKKWNIVQILSTETWFHVRLEQLLGPRHSVQNRRQVCTPSLGYSHKNYVSADSFCCVKWIYWSVYNVYKPVLRIRNPGSGAFLPQGSGIRDEFFPDPGSRIPDPKHD